MTSVDGQHIRQSSLEACNSNSDIIMAALQMTDDNRSCNSFPKDRSSSRGQVPPMFSGAVGPGKDVVAT